MATAPAWQTTSSDDGATATAVAVLHKLNALGEFFYNFLHTFSAYLCSSSCFSSFSSFQNSRRLLGKKTSSPERTML